MTLSPYTQTMNPDVQVQLAKLGAALERAAYWLAHPNEETTTSEVGRLAEQYAAACRLADIRFIDPKTAEVYQQHNEYLVRKERVDRDQLSPAEYRATYHQPLVKCGQFSSTPEDRQFVREHEASEWACRSQREPVEADRMRHKGEAETLGNQLAKAQLRARALLAEHAAADADVRRAAQFGEVAAINSYLTRDTELIKLLGVPT